MALGEKDNEMSLLSLKKKLFLMQSRELLFLHLYVKSFIKKYQNADCVTLKQLQADIIWALSNLKALLHYEFSNIGLNCRHACLLRSFNLKEMVNFGSQKFVFTILSTGLQWFYEDEILSLLLFGSLTTHSMLTLTIIRGTIDALTLLHFTLVNV